MAAAKGQSAASQIKTRDAIKALQKEIDLNNKLADARLKALDVAKTEGDLAREIEKAKLGYNQAVATGDTAKAQQYQLDIKGYQSTMQYRLCRARLQVWISPPMKGLVQLVQSTSGVYVH
jgi:hypothetical protein